MRRTVVLLAAVLVAGLVGVMPASSAASMDPPDTPRINLFGGTPDQFAAYQAFHVRHGWAPAKGDSPGDLHFYLFVDGAQIAPDFIGCLGEAQGPCRDHVFEFPEGLEPGVHDFTAIWMAPCETWTQYTDCVKDSALMTHPDFTREFEIEFVNPFVGGWVTDDGNSNTYVEIQSDGGFYLLDPSAVVCGLNPAEVADLGVFVPGDSPTYEVVGDIICPPDDEPVFSGWQGVLTFDGLTDTLTDGDGLVYSRVDGYESIRESGAQCAVQWFEADSDPATPTPDKIHTECDGVNIRNANGDYVLVLTAVLDDGIKEAWTADGSPASHDTGCLASYLFNRRDGFTAETMFFTDSARTYSVDDGDLEFVEVCFFEAP